jgi:phage tail tape-measure protein
MFGPIRLLLAGSVLALAACGTDPTDRVQGGAAAGAATGAGIGIIGGPVGMALGAVVGGGAGAITGASTDAKQVDLGSPPWSDH